MDVTKENTIFDVLKERLTSPISGGFIIIWLVHNWDYSLIVLSKNFTTERKIQLMNARVNWFDDFWMPAFVTFIYVLAMPFLSQLYEEYVIKRKTHVTRTKQSQEDLINDEKKLGGARYEFCVESIRLISEVNRINNFLLQGLGNGNNSKLEYEQRQLVITEMVKIQQTLNQYLEVSSEVMDSYRRVSSTSLRDIEEKLINCIGIVRRIMKSDKKDGGN